MGGDFGVTGAWIQLHTEAVTEVQDQHTQPDRDALTDTPRGASDEADLTFERAHRVDHRPT
jgi:hypothetical protein